MPRMLVMGRAGRAVLGLGGTEATELTEVVCSSRGTGRVGSLIHFHASLTVIMDCSMYPSLLGNLQGWPSGM